MVAVVAIGGCGDDLPGDATAYEVTASVINDAGLLGALQFEISAASISGGWVGSAGGVDCAFNVSVGLSQCNDRGNGRLVCALVDVSGFTTPTSIVTCRFATVAEPSAQDFLILVGEASDVDLRRVIVDMAITDVRVSEDG